MELTRVHTSRQEGPRGSGIIVLTLEYRSGVSRLPSSALSLIAADELCYLGSYESETTRRLEKGWSWGLVGSRTRVGALSGGWSMDFSGSPWFLDARMGSCVYVSWGGGNQQRLAWDQREGTIAMVLNAGKGYGLVEASSPLDSPAKRYRRYQP
jgi:hypothetical protein